MDLQRRVLELEEELRLTKLKIKEIIIRKASVVLREQYIQLETDYNEVLQQLQELKDKDDRFIQRVNHIKMTLKLENDKYREVIQSERQSLHK